MKIKACIFDLDGTLLDTLADIRYYLNEMLAKYSLPTVSEQKTKIFVGKGASNLVCRAVADAGIDVECDEGRALCEKICREFVALYDSNPNYLTVPYAGICENLLKLRASGKRLCVLSNKPDSMVRKLVEIHFGDIFEIVRGATADVPLKPDPAAALAICRELGVLPSETAYFGDTSTDIKTGINYGAGKIVGVAWGFREPRELEEAGAHEVIYTASDFSIADF